MHRSDMATMATIPDNVRMVTCSPEKFMWMYESMGKISNITNSSDPQMINSRVFCGNLNTFTLTKDDVESIFKRYGRIIGISMHKGYAFVQYTNEYDARNAVAGEDQRIYAGQPVDVNMASEPKPNRPSRKRPQGAGSEWDYYYNAPAIHPGPGLIPRDSQLAPPFLKRPHHELLDLDIDDFTPIAPRGLVPPPLKRPRPEMMPQLKMPAQLKRNLIPLPGNAAAMMKAGRILVPRLRTGGKMKTAVPIKVIPRPSENPGEYESPDILICGNCKQTFSHLEKLLTHKQTKCKLRFLCKCNEESVKQLKAERGEPATLSCATCQADFTSCWELCQHVQTNHGLQIYVNPNTNNKCENSTSNKEETESTNDDKASQSQSLEDGDAGSSDVATEPDGDIVGVTSDGTTIIFAEEDMEEADVSLDTEEEASTVKSSDSVDGKDCDNSGENDEAMNVIANTSTPETKLVDAE